jgi:hypothetical protein
MKEKEKANNNKMVAGGICIPAGLLIGLGVGWIFGYLVQGILIGLGAGFFALALIMALKNDIPKS